MAARRKRLKTEMVGFRAFSEDMATIRSQAAAAQVPWSQQLRLLIHEALAARRSRKPTRIE